MGLICHNVTKGDTDIAIMLGYDPATGKGAYCPYRVATLRGMYDSEHSDSPIDMSNPVEAAKKISEYRGKLKSKTNTAVRSAGSNRASVYTRMKAAFTTEERFNRVNMVASLVTQTLDALQRNNPGRSRMDFLKGYKEGDRNVAGEFAIFDSVYNILLNRMYQYAMQPNGIGREKADKIAKVLENWDGIVTFARDVLRETENVQLGNNIEFVSNASLDNLDDNELSELYPAEESKRESWQETNDMQSAFGTAGARTRAILRMTPECDFARDKNGVIIVENGTPKIEVKTDDLGFTVMGNPVSRHQTLLDVLRGATDSRDMMNKLAEAGKQIAWINPVLHYLQSHPKDVTNFWTDFHKNFQEDSSIERSAKRESGLGGITRWITTRLNKTRDVLTPAFTFRVAKGKSLSANSVYDESGNVNWDNLRKVRASVMEWLGNPDDKSNVFNGLKGKYWQKGVATALQRRDFIVETSRALGLDMDADTASALMRSTKDLREFLDNLKELFTYGIDKAITAEEKEAWVSGKRNPKVVSYSKIAARDKGKDMRALEKIRKLNTLITKFREGLKVESRVPWRDSRGNSISLFSNINPCYMGDKFELIQGFVDQNNKEGLKNWLETNYLASPFFRDKQTGRIYNRWLRDMYEACSKPAPLSESIGDLFYYKRMLGTPDLNFEDFTSKQVAIDFLYEYTSDRETGKAGTALYPIFILGDSGVQKFMRQRVYSKEDIIDALYDVYEQEIMRQKLVASTNEFLTNSGKLNNALIGENGETLIEGRPYSGIDNYSQSASREVDGHEAIEGSEALKAAVSVLEQEGFELERAQKPYFSTLVFLNEDKYKLSDNPTEDEVKKVIRQYLNDSYFKFKDKLKHLGLFETKEVTETVTENGKQVTRKVQKYVYLDQFLNGKTLDEALSDYYINTKFATIEQLQLMTVDPAFYRDTKDLQKRYKEIHAPGTSLDIYAVDPSTGQLVCPDATERVVYFDDISIDSNELNEEFMRLMKKVFEKKPSIWKKYEENTLTDGQGYRTLTSYRKVMIMHDNSWTEEMEDAYQQIMNLRSTYGKGEIPVEEIKKIEELAVVFKPIKPYMYTQEHLVVNELGDMQPIPVQHKYAEAVLIPELMPQGSKLRDLAYWMDEHTDKDGNPQPIDMIGSTKICKVGCFGSTKIDHLEQYDEEILARRQAQNIAGNEVSNTERLNFALGQAFVHQLSYSDYRIQTNVPNHVHQAQLFGTQVKKLIMAGVIKYKGGQIVDDYRYEKYVGNHRVNLGGKSGSVRLTGRNLLAFYNSLVVANQLDSFQQFNQAIFDKNGLSQRFIQNIVGNSRESMDNILSLCIDEATGEFVMPLFEGGLEHDSSAFMLSLFKKMVNKQLINGGSAVQVSAMGIKDYSEDGGLHFIFEYEKDENGEFVLDKEGNKIPVNILYAEAEIPFDFSYTDEDGNTVTLDYDDYCNEDGTFKMKEGKPLLEWDYPGITDIVAYRIPTERDYSMLNLKVVRCSRKIAGGTIKVPLEGTTIAGFDFDIDKLYFMRKEFVAEKGQEGIINKLISSIVGSKSISWEEYDYDKTPLENSRVARNNMLLHLIQQRLMDPETLEQRTTPGGFEEASKSARIMRELNFGEGIMKDGKVDWEELDARARDKSSDPEPNYDPSDPYTMILYNQLNQIAGKLIGVFANHNTNHALASLLKKFQLVKGMEIEFAGHTAAEGYGFNLLQGPKGVDVDLNLAEFLAASVDAVKDPVLNYLNFNTLTANSGALLARLGYNTLEIGLLFNQPIIREVCDYAFNNDLSLEDAIRDVYNAYYYYTDPTTGRMTPRFKGDLGIAVEGAVSKDALAGNIIKQRENPDWLKTAAEPVLQGQLEILNLFKRIATTASEVNEFVTSTKFTASNAVKSTFGDMYSQQMKVDNYVSSMDESSLDILLTDHPDLVMQESPIVNDEQRLMPLRDKRNFQSYMDALLYNPLAYEQCMFDLNREAISNMNRYYPYETPLYKGVREAIRQLTKSKYLDGDTINSIHRDLLVYLLATQEHSDFNGDIIKEDKKEKYGEITTRQYYTEHFSDELLEFLENNPELKSWPIFEYMVPGDNPVTGNTTLNVIGIGGLAPYQREALRDSWDELNTQFPEIAKDLFLYNFYKLGFDFSPVVFMNLAPTGVKKSLKVPGMGRDGRYNEDKTYVDFLNDVLDGKFHIHDDDFIIQYLCNHSDNKSLVYKVASRTAKAVINKLAYNSTTYQYRSSFVLDATSKENKNNAKIFVLSSDKEHNLTWFRPALMIEGVLYIAQGNGSTFNESTNGTMTYVRYDILGSKHSKSYSGTLSRAERRQETFSQEEEQMQDNPIMPEGSSSIDGTMEKEVQPFNKEAVTKEIAHEMFTAFENLSAERKYELTDGVPITEEGLFREYMQEEDAVLQQMIADIRKACRENGILVLDDQGELLESC